jgi:hypothetical protein
MEECHIMLASGCVAIRSPGINSLPAMLERRAFDDSTDALGASTIRCASIALARQLA